MRRSLVQRDEVNLGSLTAQTSYDVGDFVFCGFAICQARDDRLDDALTGLAFAHRSERKVDSLKIALIERIRVEVCFSSVLKETNLQQASTTFRDLPESGGAVFDDEPEHGLTFTRGARNLEETNENVVLPMATWYYKLPGQEVLLPKEIECEGEFLIGDRPDWVRAPDFPDVPGGPRKVLGMHLGPCPHPDYDHEVQHYQLEGLLQLAECEQAGFLWFKRRG